MRQTYARYLLPDANFTPDQERTIIEQSGKLPYETSFEFPRKRLRMVKCLGSGNFGEVWLAQAFQISLLDPRNKV